MMMTDKAWKLAQKHGGSWGEHPDVLRSYWKHEIINDKTQLTYWDYVIMKLSNRTKDAQISS